MQASTLSLRYYVFDSLFSPAPKVFAGAAHMFSKVFAASYYAAPAHVATHAFAGFAYLGAAFLHLPRGGVVILLSNAIQRHQG